MHSSLIQVGNLEMYAIFDEGQEKEKLESLPTRLTSGAIICFLFFFFGFFFFFFNNRKTWHTIESL